MIIFHIWWEYQICYNPNFISPRTTPYLLLNSFSLHYICRHVFKMELDWCAKDFEGTLSN